MTLEAFADATAQAHVDVEQDVLNKMEQVQARALYLYDHPKERIMSLLYSSLTMALREILKTTETKPSLLLSGKR